MATKCPRCQFLNPEDTFFCGKGASPFPFSRNISVAQTATLQTPIKELNTGSVFSGRYQIIERLGKGNIGAAFYYAPEKGVSNPSFF